MITKKNLTLIVVVIIVATLSLFTGSIASANGSTTATPAPGGISGYVNQGTPEVQTTATPPANAIVVTPMGATPPAGFEDAGGWPQDYDNQPFSVAPVGEANQDGWSWTNWNYLVVTLTETVQNVVVLWDSWEDNSQDAYGAFSGNAGDTFIVNVTGGEGTSQVDFYWTNPTPTPTDVPPTEVPPTDVPPTDVPPTPCPPKVPCVPKVIYVDPQTVECILPLGGTVISASYGKQLVQVNQGGWDNIQFTDGDLMNGLYRRYLNGEGDSTITLVLSTGEVIQLQPTPNVDHGYSTGCFIQWSSTWTPGSTPEPGRAVETTTYSIPVVIPCPPGTEDN